MIRHVALLALQSNFEDKIDYEMGFCGFLLFSDDMILEVGDGCHLKFNVRKMVFVLHAVMFKEWALTDGLMVSNSLNRV